ncbi:MAG: FAD-binding protein [Caldilineaceae bacterium]
MLEQISSIAQLQEAVRQHVRILPRGGGSKSALSTPGAQDAVLDLRGLSGILEYQPDEYTLTALAGTPVAAIEQALAEHGQYLPFEPPLAAQGATLGGTVAAGLSGAGRYRYGGVRDFLIGVRMVDGCGQIVRGGGKVVKNAAGFDLPKLLVGSLGRLGVLAEVSFKVFPRPKAYGTLRVDCPAVTELVNALGVLAKAPFDIDALDVIPHSDAAAGGTLHMRLGGLDDVLQERADHLLAYLQTQVSTITHEASKISLVRGDEEAALWQAARAFGWAAEDAVLAKIPTTPQKLLTLEPQLAAAGLARRYSVGGNVVWVAAPPAFAELNRIVDGLQLSGLNVLGAVDSPWLGKRPGLAFAQRIKQALDPDQRFLPLA